MIRRSWRRTQVVAAAAVAVACFTGVAGGVTLQSAYDAAGPGGGYDKFLLLDRGTVYTGGLTVSGVRCCIHGAGAVIDLGPGAEILAVGENTQLDVDHCIIVNGENGLHYDSYPVPASVGGMARNNTIYGCVNGIVAFYTGSEAMVIENNIITGNSNYGIYVRQYYEPGIYYNDVWDNVGGPYVYECG